MKNYRILTRLMLKNMVASMNPFAQGGDDVAKKRGIGKAIALVLLSLYGIGFMLWIEIKLYNLMAAAHQPLLLPGLAILMGFATVGAVRLAVELGKAMLRGLKSLLIRTETET